MAQESMGVQAFRSEATVEGFDERVDPGGWWYSWDEVVLPGLGAVLIPGFSLSSNSINLSLSSDVVDQQVLLPIINVARILPLCSSTSQKTIPGRTQGPVLIDPSAASWAKSFSGPPFSRTYILTALTPDPVTFHETFATIGGLHGVTTDGSTIKVIPARPAAFGTVVFGTVVFGTVVMESMTNCFAS